jgi:hypothetical protein
MKVNKQVVPVSLGQVKGERPMHLICQALFNHWQVNAWGSAVKYDDTIAMYSLLTETRLTKATLERVRTFVEGMLAGLSTAGMI